MSTSDPSVYSRRLFMRNGMVMGSAALSAPAFLVNSAQGMVLRMLEAGVTSVPGVPDDRILVVVQLGGGNDGLNTVVPHGYGEYYKARPGIGIPADQVLKVAGDDSVGLHPALKGLKALHDDGMLGIVQGVGYPNPNRSHFKSMDIWQTADMNGTGDGWLGRYLDAECCGYGKGESGKPDGSQKAKPAQVNGMPAVSIGRTAPIALQGRAAKPVSFESADLFKWSGEEIHESLKDPYHDITRRGEAQGVDENSNAAFLLRTAMDAQVASDTIRKAVGATPLVQYPGSAVAKDLQMVAKMIRAGLKTRVYYVSHGSFDTHAGQGGAQGRHAQLLTQWSDAVKAFYDDLKKQGNAERVLTMSFSEFGRRVSQNASQGTDHGTAAPVFLFGPMVKQGVLNPHPSLRDLDSGDLKHTVDFRSLYAGLLDGWLKGDSKYALEGTFKPFESLRKS